MTDENVKALLEKAKESLEVARKILGDGHYGFSASRAYYAMFYVAEALLGHLRQGYSSHSAVISAFGREYAKTKRLDAKFHQWLIAAQNIRITGDYGIETQVSKKQAEQVCQRAGEFIHAAERHLSGEER